MLSSWNSPVHPSKGNFFASLEVSFIPEFVIWKGNGGDIYWPSGPWNGLSFMGVPEMDTYLSGYNDLDIDYNTYYLYILQTISIKLRDLGMYTSNFTRES